MRKGTKKRKGEKYNNKKSKKEGKGHPHGSIFHQGCINQREGLVRKIFIRRVLILKILSLIQLLINRKPLNPVKNSTRKVKEPLITRNY